MKEVHSCPRSKLPQRKKYSSMCSVCTPYVLRRHICGVKRIPYGVKVSVCRTLPVTEPLATLGCAIQTLNAMSLISTRRFHFNLFNLIIFTSLHIFSSLQTTLLFHRSCYGFIEIKGLPNLLFLTSKPMSVSPIHGIHGRNLTLLDFNLEL